MTTTGASNSEHSRNGGNAIREDNRMDKTVVVPVEPTDEMIDAAFNEFDRRGFRISSSDVGTEDLAGVFQAMIAAAPAPAAQDEREAHRSICNDARFMAALDGYMDAVTNDERNSERRIKQRLEIFAAADAWCAALTAPQDAQERDKVLEDALHNASVWKKLAENYYGLYAYPDSPELGEGALDAYAQKYCGLRSTALTTAQPADKPEGKAEQQEEPGNGDAEYAVIVDRRDLFDYLRAAWREGQSYGACPEAESWREASTHAANRINEWSTMRPAHPPAQPQQLTDEQILALWRSSIKGVSLHPEVINFARALLAAGKERT